MVATRDGLARVLVMRGALLAWSLIVHTTLLDEGGRARSVTCLGVIGLMVTSRGRLEGNGGARCLTGGCRFGGQR